jgi:hypothetical protein
VIERALRLAGRVVLWAAILLVFANGIVALMKNFREPEPQYIQTAASEKGDSGFPEEDAAVFAARFAHDYLSYDSKDPESRREQLSVYIDDSFDPLVGWDGSGRLVAVNSIPVDVDIQSDGLGVVTVAVNVSGPRWVYLAVPISTEGDALVVADRPALVPAPEVAQVATDDTLAGIEDPDPALAGRIQPSIESFFKAFASGKDADLAYFLPPGRTLRGLDGAVELDAIESLEVSQGGREREAVGRVRWIDPLTGGALSQTYRLTLVERDGRWYVDRLGVLPGDE